jgi:hypothetical protein
MRTSSGFFHAVASCLAVIALTACADPDEGPAVGGADANLTSQDKHVCNVVDVSPLNDHLFEEGLGSAYAIDDEGNPEADGDSIQARVEPKPKGLEVSIGQMRFSPEEGDAVAAVKADPDAPFKAYTVTPKGSKEIFEIRIFKEHQLGVILHKADASARAERLATLDCRKGAEQPFF